MTRLQSANSNDSNVGNLPLGSRCLQAASEVRRTEPKVIDLVVLRDGVLLSIVSDRQVYPDMAVVVESRAEGSNESIRIIRVGDFLEPGRENVTGKGIDRDAFLDEARIVRQCVDHRPHHSSRPETYARSILDYRKGRVAE